MMFKDSVFKRLSKKEAEDLVNAVKHNKYWKISPSHREFICVVALSRARVKSRRGMYARATHYGRVEVSKSAASFCRKWRILLIDTRRMLAVSVLTWRAFKRIVSKGLGPEVCSMLETGSVPPYINTRGVLRMCSAKHQQE
ncbi:MAG: hypothetical protein HA496_04915 [Thaumarchaeota archaeon]|jgi:hypothetical protein|nr:hypothetical protein [Nitrososphaerota archaeon]